MQAIIDFWQNSLVPAWNQTWQILGELWAARPSFLTDIPPLVLRCAFFVFLLLALFVFLQLITDMIKKTKGRLTPLMCTLAVSVVLVFLLGGSL